MKKLIKAAKQRGFVTLEELNRVLPSDQVQPATYLRLVSNPWIGINTKGHRPRHKADLPPSGRGTAGRTLQHDMAVIIYNFWRHTRSPGMIVRELGGEGLWQT